MTTVLLVAEWTEDSDGDYLGGGFWDSGSNNNSGSTSAVTCRCQLAPCCIY
jgi:hypothetical protein